MQKILLNYLIELEELYQVLLTNEFKDYTSFETKYPFDLRIHHTCMKTIDALRDKSCMLYRRYGKNYFYHNDNKHSHFYGLLIYNSTAVKQKINQLNQETNHE